MATSANDFTGVPVFVEVGGVKRGCKPTLLPSTARCVDVQALPNPHSTIVAGSLDENIEAIERWIRLQPRGAALFDTFVEEGVREVRAGRSVRVQCFGGRHRSQAVARAIERRVAGTMAITLALRDAAATALIGDHHSGAVAGGGVGTDRWRNGGIHRSRADSDRCRPVPPKTQRKNMSAG